VCNHISVLDILSNILGPFFPGFTPNEGIEKIPMVGTLATALGSLYIERGGTQEARDRIVNTIIERQA